ncbi:MAG: EAL domain-containing protein [Gemmatimonadaceae bacterium]|nr:EAL domain-containing protein [Gemmatimonadaceae bacterium]
MPDTDMDRHEAIMQFLYRAPIGLVEVALDGTIEMLNPMAARLLLPLAPDGEMENLFAVLARVAPQLGEMSAAFLAPSGTVCEGIRIPLDAGTGGNPAVQVLAVSLLKLSATKLMAVVSDVTLEVQREQQGLDRRLNAAERTDTLTRMPNRAAVRECLQATMDREPAAKGPGFAVLFLNCDRFKQINDTHGHSVGDRVLGMMAERLRAALRLRERIGVATDVKPIAARVGGDEFVVVLNDLQHQDDVFAVAQRLLDVLTTPYGVDALQLTLGVSMGIVLEAQATGDADAVLQVASVAMTEAKRGGGMRFAVFEPEMQLRAARRGDIEADLRSALAESQLYVVYQPVVGLRTRGAIDCTAGVEALVRWLHPTRGVVVPVEFIAVAEECGLIGAVGDYVLNAACRQFVQWQRDLGLRAPRTVAVNLSRAQLEQPGFVSSVEAILRATHMPPASLQLEVTESLAAQHEQVRAQLRQLKSLGLTLALDDFGTGYSSLSSLHLLPVDTVKIDRSFVSQSDSSAHHRVLIEATVRVANSLGMSTVAEGIETHEQAVVVRDLGCDKGQGFLYSAPLLPDDVAHWLRAGTVRAA